jgi:5-methylcytosine-specific restriction endonuclease McrA
MARSLDHVTPLSKGGDPLARENARLAHKRCNTIRSNKARARARPEDRGHIEVDPSTI